MTDSKPQYIEGVGWRYPHEHHSMHRRMEMHDYHKRCIYMITISVENRRPLLGQLVCGGAHGTDPHIVPTELGREVERCWYAISQHYPQVTAMQFQLMPDHVHGMIFVRQEMAAHLGKIVNGFKIGCNRAYRRLVLGVEPHETERATACHSPKHPTKGMLFETGYQDSVLTGRGQLERMKAYIADNPRRLAIKRSHPDLFRVVGSLTVGGQCFAAIGNRWLLDLPVRMQVRCHNNTSPENMRLIEQQKAYFLRRGAHGGVVVSPCISEGEKQIARAALNARQPLIVILENGFPPLYKPPGRYFNACADGLLLMLAPWPYHMERRKITRQQCLALNDMAYAISTEPWTPQLEQRVAQGGRG